MHGNFSFQLPERTVIVLAQAWQGEPLSPSSVTTACRRSSEAAPHLKILTIFAIIIQSDVH